MAVEVSLPETSAPRSATELNTDELRQERSALRRRRLLALGLVGPLLVFIFFSFVAPIASMLYRSVYNPDVVELIPETIAALSSWQQQTVPDEPVLTAMAVELSALARERRAGVLAAAVN